MQKKLIYALSSFLLVGAIVTGLYRFDIFNSVVVENFDDLTDWSCLQGTCATVNGNARLGSTDHSTLLYNMETTENFEIIAKYKINSGYGSRRINFSFRSGGEKLGVRNFSTYSVSVSGDLETPDTITLDRWDANGIYARLASLKDDGVIKPGVYGYIKIIVLGEDIKIKSSSDGYRWVNEISYTDPYPMVGRKLMIYSTDYSTIDIDFVKIKSL